MDDLNSQSASSVDEASRPYLGQWHRLVSTTNWEKGRIIAEWRHALVTAGAAAQEHSDEAWSRRVGYVSSQHVGRLRRVYDRFGGVREDYSGLYWSHFQAALDWDDAEMWLEGAVQSNWSVSQMRRQRWEVLGAPAELKPHDDDIVASELDEDAYPADDAAEVNGWSDASDHTAAFDYATNGSAHREDSPADGPLDRGALRIVGDDLAVATAEPTVRPFEKLPSLPADMSEACELFKLAILRHKLAGWQEVARDDVLATLEALERLVLAPAE